MICQNPPCEREFEPAHDNQLHCSAGCRIAYKRARRREREGRDPSRPKFGKRICRFGGCEFIGGNNAKVCPEHSALDRAEQNRKWYVDHDEHMRAYRQARYVENREAAKERSRRWREENRERHYELNRRWYENNKEKARASVRAHYARNREKMSKQHHDWYVRNREKIRQKMHTNYAATRAAYNARVKADLALGRAVRELGLLDLIKEIANGQHSEG